MNEHSMSDIKSLPLQDRIQLVEDIWDSIARDADQLSLTAAQELELNRRLEQYRVNPDASSPWPVVRQRIER